MYRLSCGETFVQFSPGALDNTSVTFQTPTIPGDVVCVCSCATALVPKIPAVRTTKMQRAIIFCGIWETSIAESVQRRGRDRMHCPYATNRSLLAVMWRYRKLTPPPRRSVDPPGSVPRLWP